MSHAHGHAAFARVEAARRAFDVAFGATPTLVAVAPGRVNLIGEHTDYNDGFVLPMAIDRGVAVAVAPRRSAIIRAHAAAFDETCEFSLDAFARGSHGWQSYVTGVAWAMSRAGLPVPGADLAIASDLPIGAGLSSSAALELAIARGLCAAAGIAWEPLAMAHLARAAENEFVGVPCGIMDQLASSLCEEGSALLIDCRVSETRNIAMPREAAIVVLDTGKRRALAATAYSERRSACERAVAALRAFEPQIASLRDVDERMLDRARDRMDEEAHRRARHVVAEIPRPVEMARHLIAGDLVRAGQLMNDSHTSLRDLYQVSCAELDTMVAAARAEPACYGARLTGAGFGGCAIALVEASSVESFVVAAAETYERATGLSPSAFAVRAAGGAALAP